MRTDRIPLAPRIGGLVVALMLVVPLCPAGAAEPGPAGPGPRAEAHTAGHGQAGGDEHEAVHLTPGQRGRLDLRVAPAERGSAATMLSRPASIAFDADRVAKIGPRLRAKVVRVVRDLGEPVAAGEPVAVMDSVALGQAKARYLTARARLQTERANHEREKTLAAEQISSEAVLLEARARHREAKARLEAAAEELRLYGLSRKAVNTVEGGSETPLSRYVLTSPIDGVLNRREVTPGQTVGPEETPIHVVDTDRLWVMIETYERDIPLLAVGQAVEVRLRALSERRFEGRIDWISEALDPDTRTLRVRAVVDNPDGVLRAGMFGTATIRTGDEGTAALVPVDAVQRVGGEPRVFVPGEQDGAFRAVGVTLGREAGGMVEVVSGIRPGDAVVVAGAFDLKSVMTASGRSAAHSH